MHWRVFGCSFYLTSSALNTSGHDLGSRRSLPTVSWKFCLLRPRSPRNSMSARVEHARDRNLSRTLVAASRTSRLHQAAYARHAMDAGSLCSIDRCQAGLHCYARQVSLLSVYRWHPQGFVPRVVLSGGTNIFQGKCAGQLWITTQSSIDVEISAKVKTYVFPDSSTFTNACASISSFADHFHSEFTMTGRAPLLHQIICPTLHLRTRTAYGVGSIYNDLQIATAAETSFSASRRDTDGVMDTRDHLLVTPSPFCWSGSFRVPDEDKEKLQEESGAHHAF